MVVAPPVPYLVAQVVAQTVAHLAPAAVRGLPPGLPPALLRAGAVTLPNGRVVIIAARGVYWAACHALGAFLCYPVDSRGDCHGIWRYVRGDAPAHEFDCCEQEVWMILDRLDPLPGPQLVR